MKDACRSRSAIVSGIFYPEEKVAAIKTLEQFGLGANKPGSALAIMAPHAGWELSGAIAAAAFNAARARNVQSVIILGPIHDEKEEGIFLSDSDIFHTPLGSLPVEKELCDELESCSTIMRINDIPHLYEHSIEVLLPMIRFCFPQASIVPILMGGHRQSMVDAVSRALDIVISSRIKTTLILVSTNLYEHNRVQLADKNGETFLDLVIQKDSKKIMEGICNHSVTACGAACMAALLGSSLLQGTKANIIARSPPSMSLEDGNGIPQYASIAFS